MVIIGKKKSHALNACMKEKKLLKTRTCLFKRDQIDGRISANELCVYNLKRKLKCSVAKIRVVLDYFMGLIQCTNIHTVALDRLYRLC